MDRLDKQAEAQVIEAVHEIYQKLDMQIESSHWLCKACGQCCDFDSFGHRLYITTPELIYFKMKLAENKIPILQMTDGVCPYRKDKKCSVYPWRFAGCRIFNCTGNADLQSRMSEETLNLCKTLCILYGMEYRYADLKGGLESIQ